MSDLKETNIKGYTLTLKTAFAQQPPAVSPFKHFTLAVITQE